MAYKIEWTDDALEDMRKVLEYLVNHWSYKTADEFEEITLSRLDTLADSPLIGITSSANKAVRSILLTKHNKLYYQISENLIIVLNIFDTRQNPSKNKFEQGG
jgi:plasmid stabilization system protein ParE